MRKKQRKILSFSTTMRNPMRIAGFLSCIKEFQGRMLTDDLITQIVKKIIKRKLYYTNYIKTNKKYNAIYLDEDITFTEKQLDLIILKSPQNHKEAGFEKGWASRFDTWFKLAKEFGFLYYAMNEKIEISESGAILCHAYEEINSLNVTDIDECFKQIHGAFLNALCKYQSDNPYRKNLNQVMPLILLLNTIMYLKQIIGDDFKGIYRKEIAFVICWQNNDFQQLGDLIIEFRRKYGFKGSDELYYEKCMELLESTNEVRFKINQIMSEGVDDFIRKMRITGVLSLRGMGRFLDWNGFEENKIKYIVDNYKEYRIFSDFKEFYNYMGIIDENLIYISTEKVFDINEIRVRALNEWAKYFTKDQVLNELKIIAERKNSKEDYLKEIDAPTRLEFLTSLSLVQNIPNIKVFPNYAIDDEGNPIFTAQGGKADIEVFDNNNECLFEVTLMKNRSQGSNEIPAITRHLQALVDESNKRNFTVFIAPTIHPDTEYMIAFTKNRYSLDIYDYTITDFTEKISSINRIEMLEKIIIHQ